MNCISKVNTGIPKNRTAYVCLAVFLLTRSYSSAQIQKLRIGIKVNPNLSIAVASKTSDFDSKHFQILNARTGFQIGGVLSYEMRKFLLEWNAFIASKGTGLKFENFSASKTDFSEVKYRTLNFSNRFFFGYNIKTNDLPFYSIFIGPTLGFDIGSINSIHGRGNFSFTDITAYHETIPPLSGSLKSLTAGISFKVRTSLKNIGSIDYGVSFDYVFSSYPSITITAEKNNLQYYTRLVPKIHVLSFDFIYYFRSKQKSGA